MLSQARTLYAFVVEASSFPYVISGLRRDRKFSVDFKQSLFQRLQTVHFRIRW